MSLGFRLKLNYKVITQLEQFVLNTFKAMSVQILK